MKIGLLGGGQLGMMLAEAATPLGHACVFLDSSATACAAPFGTLLIGAPDDPAMLQTLAKQSDVVTFESENIPVSSIEIVEKLVPVFPAKNALRDCQDRFLEKQLCEAIGVPVAPYATVDTVDDLATAVEKVGMPCILKTRTLGYDGKGQVVIQSEADMGSARRLVQSQPCIVEQKVSFVREVSVIASRDQQGNIATYPLTENIHKEGILHISRAPATASDALTRNATSIIEKVLTHYNYVGTLTIELFEVAGETLLINELAPRVHNSGHWTIEGAETSQFANHVRCITGERVGPTTPLGHAAMVNVVGTPIDVSSLQGMDGVFVHLYGKEPRPKRKLGHVTIVHQDAAYVEDCIEKVLTLL